jgi:hypothetical protein
MPRKTKDAPGRVTPKGGNKRTGTGSSDAAGGRYTAPIPKDVRHSPPWYPYVILTFFGLGVVCIMFNYLGLLPGGASNVYLFVGLGLIVLGFIAATRYH